MDLSLIVILYIANIAFWCVIIFKFNSFFSTKEVLQRTRDALDKMLADMNKQAARNIDIIEARIAELKKVSADAERNIKVLNFELDKAKKRRIFEQEFSSKNVGSLAVKQNKNVDIYQQEQIQGNLFSINQEIVSKDGDSIEVYQTGDAPIEENIETNQIQEESIVTAEIPQITVSDFPIKPQKSYKQQIKELAAMGMTTEEIATEVGRSAQEVSVILEFMKN